MPHLDPPRPRAATCEDWDEDNDEDESLPITHPSTDAVPVQRTQPELHSKASYERRRNDGSDSGYSSKANTIDSDLSGPKRLNGLTTRTAVAERERQPYSMAHTRPEAQRQPSGRSQIIEEAQIPKPKKYKHDKGLCVVCDKYGWHDPAKIPSRTSVPPSPQKSRPSVPTKIVEDLPNPPDMRRTSSNRGTRPMSMYASVPTQFQYAPMAVQSPIYGTPLSTPVGWNATPLTPTIGYTPSYSYQPLPLSGGHVAYVEQRPGTYEYFDSNSIPVPQIRPPNPKRRSNTYGEPVIRHVSAESAPKTAQIVGHHENQPIQKPQKAPKTQDHERVIMGPPPRPEPRPVEVVLSRRPSLKKATTYTPSSSTHRRSATLDSDQIPPLPPTPTTRERHTSPSRPPSSYRGPISSEPGRPGLSHKSQTYSTPIHTTKIASSDRQSTSVTAGIPRRTTMPSSLPRERHEEEAEAYQNDRRRLTSVELMTEALRKTSLTKRDVSERSETGSSKSHKSHRSGSRASSSTGAKAQTILKVGDATITTNGHVTVDRGGNIKIDTKGGGSMTLEGGSIQKRIERAPSVASRTSRVSAQSGSFANGDKIRDTANMGLSRRSSRQTDSFPEQIKEQLRDDFGRDEENYDEIDRDRGEGRKRSQSHARNRSRAPSAHGRRGSGWGERGVSDFF